MQERTVIHLDIADFAAAIEAGREPSLAGRPLAIALSGSSRARVYDMSEEAYCQGVRKGMPLGQARHRCRDIKILPPRFHAYEQVMKAMFKTICAASPRVESGVRDGHFYLDVSGMSRLAGPGVDMAFRLKKQIEKEFDLSPVWSVASSKLVAKVAARMAKPCGEYIVPPGDESAFLAPLPLYLLPMLNRNQVRKLNRFNLTQVCQARELTREQLSLLFSDQADRFYNALRGTDFEPVEKPDLLQLLSSSSSRVQPNSLSRATSQIQAGSHNRSFFLEQGHVFAEDTNDKSCLEKGLYQVCETLGAKLRQGQYAAVTLNIKLTYSDGKMVQTASAKFDPVSSDLGLFRQGQVVLKKAWQRRVRIQHLQVRARSVRAACLQAGLFDSQKAESRLVMVSRAVDRIREKFGACCVGSGLSLVPDGSS